MTMQLTDPIFTDADKAREYLESQRWADGVFCPHCGGSERIKKMTGKSHRPGLYQCGHCRQQFTVTVGTVFERSKVPLNKWLLATYLLSSSKKGMSAHQLHRMLGVTYKTAWFMAHRIREAMRQDELAPFGSDGGAVEADETYIGNRDDKAPGMGGARHKYSVFSLVDRETGRSHTVVLDAINKKNIVPILNERLSKEAKVYTDGHSVYRGIEWEHDTVDHWRGEYARGPVHSNTVEGFFSIFKRGMKGVYQHCGRQHLHRYTGEFDFRYSNRKITDWERTGLAIKGAEGKRLTYRRTDTRASA